MVASVYELASLHGLEALAVVGRDLIFDYNEKLPAGEVQALRVRLGKN